MAEKSVVQIEPEKPGVYSDELEADSVRVPEYLREFYWWAYLHPLAVKFFDRQWIVNLILSGNFKRLRDATLAELNPGNSFHRTLQMACVYGDFTPKLADRLGSEARLDVIDAAPIQLENLKRKIRGRPNIFAGCQDASALSFANASFDQVVVFFLLHELPPPVRKAAVREALRVVKPGGKLVFVDYHKPVGYHPHRYLMRPIFSTLEPFALDLWKHEIADWVETAETSIDKTTYFGGLYQKVVVSRQ